MTQEQKPPSKHQVASTYRQGDRVGKFVVRDFIAAGGMGELYRAWDPDLNRPVAIKTLLPTARSLVTDPMFFRRFREEAKAIANLEHENIVRVLHFGETEDRHQPYIVMPFLAGEDLSRRLTRARGERTPIPIEEAIEIILGACRGVHACHLAGIVHRDLKPGNIFLTHDQESGRLVVKVLDFGVARPTRREHQETTLDGLVIGTPHYMSPEQARAMPADAQSDQYSLAALLYSMLTLCSPYDYVTKGLKTPEETIAARLRALREGQKILPLAKYVPSAPVLLDAVVMRALSSDPNRRYASVYEFGKALLPYASAESRNYLSSYYRAAPLPIVMPQASATVEDDAHGGMNAPAPSAPPPTDPPSPRPSLVLPNQIKIIKGAESKKITAPLRADGVPTAIRPPGFNLLRNAVSSSSGLDDGTPTEVRAPSAAFFGIPSVASVAGPLPPLASPTSDAVLASPSQAGTSAATSSGGRPILLVVGTIAALIVTLGVVAFMHRPRNRVGASPPPFLFHQQAAPLAPVTQGPVVLGTEGATPPPVPANGPGPTGAMGPGAAPLGTAPPTTVAPPSKAASPPASATALEPTGAAKSGEPVRRHHPARPRILYGTDGVPILK